MLQVWDFGRWFRKLPKGEPLFFFWGLCLIKVPKGEPVISGSFGQLSVAFRAGFAQIAESEQPGLIWVWLKMDWIPTSLPPCVVC